MNSKNLLIGAAAILVLGVGVFAFTKQSTEPALVEGGSAEETPITTYHSPLLGLEFDYPEGYTLSEQGEGSAKTLILTETAVLEEYEAAGALEGPPSVTVQLFDNDEGVELEQWIKSHPASNYHLATDTELLVGEVAGEPARAYEYSGLYENNSVVVAHESTIYLFTVGWLSQDDKNLDVFGHMLDSVQFI